MNVTVLGAGAWGTALAVHAAAAHPTRLWARDAEQAARLRSARRNARYLPEVVLPPVSRGCGARQLTGPATPEPLLAAAPICAFACACCASNIAWKFTSDSITGGKPARVQTSETMARRYG